MPSKLALLWMGLPDEFDTVELKVGGWTNNLYLVCNTLRTGQYQWTRGTYDAENRGQFRNAFLADYNQLNEFTVTYGGSNTLYIESPIDNFFTIPEININSAWIVVQGIEEIPSVPPINITDISEVTGTCSTVDLEVTTDVLAVTVYGTYSILGNTNNPFTLTAGRGTTINIGVTNADGESELVSYRTPDKLLTATSSVSVVNSPSGATVTASTTINYGLTLEYSLDDITYQAANFFTGITLGSYTMYIRDQFGCTVEVPFEVEDFESGGVGVLYPVADLPPKSNSIRYSRIVDFATNAKNDENTQSCESKYTLNPSLQYQLFQNDNLITTQFRSNYGTIEPKVIETDGTETLLPLTQQSTNIGLTDSRDALKYRIEENKTGIYFTSGNTYDFYTTLVNGSYALNGGLPQWGTIGGYVVIGGAWYEIINKIFDSSKNAEVLVVELNYTGAEVAEIVGSIFNAQQYEVYEFTVDMNLFSDSFIRVRIDQTDTAASFPDVSFQSEIIRTAASFPRTAEIEYWNDENSGNIVYSSGIRHKIYIPMSMVIAVALEESAADRSDSSAYLIESNVHEGTDFRSAWISKEMMRKLVLAYNHQNILIDGVPYVKEGETSVEPTIGTDLYKVNCTLIKSSEVYSTTPQDATAGSAIEIPNLLTDDGAFLKYKDNN